MLSFRRLQVHVLVYVLLILSIKSKEFSSNGVTRWAVLIAGSNGYGNYRHQADICHAYQILKRGGLKDENIVVFMYDDIAYDTENPRPGVIINKPYGDDVYEGVPKDYTGDDVNVNNFFNVILGNKSGITGGSGKVVDSGPDDNIFIFYADHGGPGVLGMIDGELIAKDLIDVLEKKHELKSYAKMVIYVEACESGSIFEGLLKNDLNIYAVTASNAQESSWAFYCPESYPYPPPEYEVCLGDLFSVSWLEDSDLHDMSSETLEEQYEVVRRRTLTDQIEETSHVMRYGNQLFEKDNLISYIGSNPSNHNLSSNAGIVSSSMSKSRSLNQRDISLLYLQRKIQKAPEGSPQREKAEREFLKEINHRKQIDQNITKILQLTIQKTNVSNMLMSTRGARQALVDDWHCFKTLVYSFKKYCGATIDYGLKYAGALANVCNMGMKVDETVSTIIRVCNDEIVHSLN